MAIEQIKMPQLGESVTEGTIEKWLVKPGDHVNKYDALAEVNTDKVTAEVPSSFTGIIKELIANEGDTLAVGEIVCTIETEGGASASEEIVEVKEAAPEEPTAETVKPGEVQKHAAPVEREKGAKARYSPAVLKISQEHGIDLSLVTGTGNEGRITRKDLLKIVESGEIPVAKVEQEAILTPSTPVATSAPAPKPAPANIPVAVGDIEIPVTGVRKAIAANMLRSKHEAPHAWTMIEVDVTSMVQYRDSIKNEFKQKKDLMLPTSLSS